MALKLWWCLVAVLQLMSIGVGLALHGRPKTGNHGFWLSVIESAVLAPVFYAAFRYVFAV